MSNLSRTCQPNVPMPFRLFHAYSDAAEYEVQAYPSCRASGTKIHLTTRSRPLVTHILGSSWERQLGSKQYINWTSPSNTSSETDEEELALRILQAGGAVIDTSYFKVDYQHTMCAEQFAAFSRQKQFLFGWPSDGGVWVLDMAGKVPLEFWERPRIKERNEDGSISEEAIREMEEDELYAETHSRPPVPDDAINTRELNGAATMEEYCTELNNLGAVFYADMSLSIEVKESGVLDKKTLTRPWQGCKEWMERPPSRSISINWLGDDRVPPPERSFFQQCVVS